MFDGRFLDRHAGSIIADPAVAVVELVANCWDAWAPYERNGKGRHAAFRFGEAYRVRTWREGVAVSFDVRRGATQPFVIQLAETEINVTGHGTEIRAIGPTGTHMTSDGAREVIGTRFLADPNFAVTINGTRVTFDDIPEGQRRIEDIEIPGFGTAHLIVIDTQKADKTTRQHGIAWRVNARLVGSPGWLGEVVPVSWTGC